MALALAGNANVGKSTLFNLLSGSSQHVANWPGKTVEIACGTLLYRGMKIEVADLPGSYSFSAHSPEEEIARRFIVEKKPSVVVDVIDVCSLERNLFFALELCELGAPLVLALNQCDLEKEKGLRTDEKALGRLLCIPVVKVSAATGFGVRKLADECIAASLSRRGGSTKKIRYSPKAEIGISHLVRQLGAMQLPYPKRYAAIKLLEGDSAITAEVEAKLSGKLKFRKIDIIAEKYRLASRIASRVQKKGKPRVSLIDRLDSLTTHRIFGYAIMFLLLGMIFYLIFAFGSFSSSLIGSAFNSLQPSDTAAGLLFEMVAGGLIAGITLVLHYVLPFFLLLSILQKIFYKVPNV
ncbi:MAG: FeoB small GTPase domain-containing protein, partial [Bacteroidota bacterium]